MKTRSILPFAVFGFLLLALFALSSCKGDDDGGSTGGGSGATPTSTQAVASVGSDVTQFGGPYPFAQHGEKAAEKERDFECYKALGLSLSEAVKLDEPLFKRSIEANKELSNGVGTQKHNFVIAKVGENIEIIVAKWKEDNPELDKDKKVSEQCQCRIDDNLGLGAANTMVNLFPEDKEADPRKVRVGCIAIEKMGRWMR